MSSTLRSARHHAVTTARSSPWVERAGRAGLASRAVLYVLVGLLAVRLAAGKQGEKTDQRGALATLAHQPFGRVLVLSIALGFLGYSAWRFTQAAIGGDDGRKGPVMRVAYAARGVLYLGLALTAVSMAVNGPSQSGSGGTHEKALTARVMTVPFGRAIVVLAGLAVIASGLWNGYRAVTRTFEKDLKEFEMNAGERRAITTIGTAGLLGRMGAFVVTGGFLAHSGWTFNPDRAVGLDASLHALAASSHGRVLLVLVGMGLIAFGAFQGATARYRRVMGS